MHLSLKKCGELKLKCCETLLKRVETLIEQSPKPIYEVGEIIEVKEDIIWFDAEFLFGKNGQISAWVCSCIDIFGEGNHRKKQKPRIYISGRINGLDYNETFAKFEKAEKELIAKGYDVCNPMKYVPFNKYWSWFDYMGEDIKLLGRCTHIYMLKDWQKSDGAWIEHEIAIRKNLTILYEQ